MPPTVVVLWSLGTTQVIGYGTLYYALSILAPDMARDLDWSAAWVFGVFSAALLLGGLAAPMAGRLVDRHGARRLMTAGSVAVAVALAATALAPDRITFAVGLVLVEMASTLVLYDAAFVALAQLHVRDAPRRIVHLTLIGGFASTLFWPLTGWLLQALSWREVFLLFAALHLLLCAPLHFLSLRAAAPVGAAPSPSGREEEREATGVLPERLRRRAFLLLAIGFSAGGIVLSGVTVHLVSLLGTLGLGASAVLVAAALGPAQVAARLVNLVGGRTLVPTGLAVLSSALLPVALVALVVASPSVAGAVLAVSLFGAGSGLVSIVRGTAPLHLFGSAGYGARLGLITAVRLFATAGAPFAFAVLIERHGAGAAIGTAIAVGVLGTACLAQLHALAGRPERGPASLARPGVLGPG